MGIQQGGGELERERWRGSTRKEKRHEGGQKEGKRRRS